MADLITVGVKELKNKLSSYLREVRRGARILVSDRNAVVAELREPVAPYGLPESANPVVSKWVEQGTLVPPSREKAELPQSPVKMPRGSAVELLDEDRREGHT